MQHRSAVRGAVLERDRVEVNVDVVRGQVPQLRREGLVDDERVRDGAVLAVERRLGDALVPVLEVRAPGRHGASRRRQAAVLDLLATLALEVGGQMKRVTLPFLFINLTKLV